MPLLWARFCDAWCMQRAWPVHRTVCKWLMILKLLMTSLQKRAVAERILDYVGRLDKGAP